MKVFKFGGASVNSAEAVRNMASIVQKHIESEPLVVVVSAMGKTTNLLEKLVPGAALGLGENATDLRRQLAEYHLGIATQLLGSDEAAQQCTAPLFAQFDACQQRQQAVAEQYNFNYDQVVSYGELLSTTIIAQYLNSHGINTLWVDARQLLHTTNHHREGRILWPQTQQACQQMWQRAQGYSVVITQGFIASCDQGTTTLGREGSDYSAAILAYCLDAESVTIWKDVPGFLNADPKYFRKTVKISRIPYNEAIELAYYGASVIHPKTVKPIQNKSIPLYIRSFVDADAEGSAVGNYSRIEPQTPLYIFRNNQILLSIQPRDYSFIAEDNLQAIFGIMSRIGIRVNLMQNSALSFSVCIDDNRLLVEPLIAELSAMFHVRYNSNLQLVTIRYYTPEVVEGIVVGRHILLEQRSRLTAQLVVPQM